VHVEHLPRNKVCKVITATSINTTVCRVVW
jgi:hypothetical protein